MKVNRKKRLRRADESRNGNLMRLSEQFYRIGKCFQKKQEKTPDFYVKLYTNTGISEI